MTSQAPSSSSVKPNFLESLFRRSRILIGIFILWTVSLVAYTIISQQSCNPILWWQQGKQTECWITSVDPEHGVITEQKKDPSHNPVKSFDDSSNRDSAEGVTLCKPEAAVIVGSVTTVGLIALTVPPPFAVAIGSAAAWGYCWFVENVN